MSLKLLSTFSPDNSGNPLLCPCSLPYAIMLHMSCLIVSTSSDDDLHVTPFGHSFPIHPANPGGYPWKPVLPSPPLSSRTVSRFVANTCPKSPALYGYSGRLAATTWNPAYSTRKPVTDTQVLPNNFVADIPGKTSPRKTRFKYLSKTIKLVKMVLGLQTVTSLGIALMDVQIVKIGLEGQQND